jgi:hypothetical protein
MLLVPGDYTLLCQTQATPPPEAQQPAQPANTQPEAKLPPEQLDSLVAPIALYPDPLLAQVLAASTYPLEIVQLQQWLEKNKGLKEAALTEAVSKQSWDPSVQAMAPLPDVVKKMAENIKWTAELGNAFLAQRGDVMDAVQRMRKRAQSQGNLKSSEQQNVETKVVEQKSVIVIQQANPEVVYVPSYNPTVVYGAPVYPYPPIAYPPPGYYAAGMAISFGVGVAMGAAWGGGWGWGAGWGHNDIDVNVNNNFVSNYNRTNANNRINSGNWQHNRQHRGAAPYPNSATANRYGGTTRGSSLDARQQTARQNQLQTGNRNAADSAARQGQLQQGNRSQLDSAGRNAAGGVDRSAGAAADRAGGNIDRSAAGERTAARDSSANRPTGGDRIGNREVPSGGGGNRTAFSGSGGSGSAARASGARGASSMRGGGGFRGGGRRR